MSLIETRYAEALLELAAEKAAIETFEQHLSIFCSIYEKDRDLQDFFLNPNNGAGFKKNVIRNALCDKLDIYIVNFISLLIEKGRIKYLPGIFREFVKMADLKRCILDIDVVSATPLNEEQLRAISEKYRKLYGKASVKARVRLDTDLVGGIKVIVGGKMTDASLKGKLKGLERLLIK